MNSGIVKRRKGRQLQAEAGESQSLFDAIFDAHIAKREFADRDVDATMATMVAEPYVHCVPIMTGGSGGTGCAPLLQRAFRKSNPQRRGGDADFAYESARTR